MNTHNINHSRRTNLDYLINHIYGSQSRFAAILKHSALSQATLSDILREKRLLHYTEARAIEDRLGIPHNWMDKNNWICDGKNFIDKYQKMTDKEKTFFNETIDFVVNKCAKA